MEKVGQNFNRADWLNAARQGGEVRMRAPNGGHAQIYNARQTLGGKVVGFFRGLVRSPERTAKREAATNEIKAFLGKFGQEALNHAGIVPGKALGGRQIAAALKFVDEKRSRSLDSMIKNPDAFLHTTQLRDLEQQLEKSKSPGRRSGLESQIAALKKFTLASHIERVTDTYTQRFAGAHDANTNDAMALAIQMKALGRQVASQDLNNPRAHGAVNDQLFKAHAKELSENHDAGAIKLAKALAGNDIMMRLFQGKTSVEEATYQIRVLAERADTHPGIMFNLVREQFEAELGSFTLDELNKADLGKDTYSAGNFSFDEIRLPGELSPNQFKKIVGDAGPTFGSEGLDYTAEAGEKLSDLAVRVFQWQYHTGIDRIVVPGEEGGFELASLPRGRPQTAPKDTGVRIAQPQKLLDEIEAFGRSGKQLRHVTPAEAVALPGTRGLTENQYGLLRSIRMQEATLENTPDATGVSPKQQVLDFMKTRYGLDGTEAQKVLDKAKTWFATAPLTVTFKGDDHFAQAATPAFGTTYKAAQEIATRDLDSGGVADLVGGSEPKDGLRVPSNTGAAARGINYLRWRVEKDDEETQHRGLTRTEQASFGAVNINFNKTGGFEGDGYYGESHMVLKDSVRDRVAFNFNKSRALRSDITMLMHDMLHNNNDGSDKTSFIDAVVHNALGLPGMVGVNNLQLEVEIFGELDMVKDVAKVQVAERGFTPQNATGLSDGARTNLTSFFGSNGVQVQGWDLTAAPPKVLPGSDALKQGVKGAAASL